jgi:hydrogenase maturation protein HypF
VTLQRVAIRVTGVVQGVGYRPFVYRLATDLGITGFVGNDASGVFAEAQGDATSVSALVEGLREGPPLARVERVATTDIDTADEHGFRIVDSPDVSGTTSIPPDTAVCDACLDEMRDPQDRRYGYAFIACTHCGPRYTIVTGLPYDRAQTTMLDFPLCDACRAEYEDPASRRFHAQPTACPACGPRLSMPVTDIVAALTRGSIVALKGVGGYHLACDARDPEAVALLRARKRRGDKPFALMVADLDTARTIISVDPTAEQALASTARPVVLAPSTDITLQACVAPGNAFLGVMLPYAPLHHLLFDAGCPRILVMTSGNLADEPICTTADEAEERLAGLADVMVHHDRRIHIACDDSVVRATGGAVQPVRRSRGYAPLPISLPMESRPLLAVGGELKTTLCVARGRHAWMSQHIGDTENLETLAMLARTATTLTGLQRVIADAVVSDAHPAYLSRRWAADEARRRGIEHLSVQHHHAHLASLLAEHGWLPGRPVLGFTFDGTGYGTDGAIWGGELLVGSYARVDRVGHLRPVLLPGGDAAIRRPLRTALAHLAAAGIDAQAGLATVTEAQPNEVAVISRMLATGVGCTPTTSMGRLFDAIASILDVRQQVDYEGQAAIELEALASSKAPSDADANSWTPLVVVDDAGITLDPTPTIGAAVAAVRSGCETATASRLFHEGLARAVSIAAVAARDATGVDTVGLTGGVFANALLTTLCQGRLAHEGFEVLVHHRVPPNDGGLALGQVAVAAAGGARTEGS